MSQEKKFITDVHTHSSFSFDSEAPLANMLAQAQKLGVAFYGVSEHFDYEVAQEIVEKEQPLIDAENYFHTARHLQDDYAGVMNVLVGAEFGFAPDEKVLKKSQAVIEKYAPDFVVNSVHCCDGDDYYRGTPFYKNGVLKEKKVAFEEYLSLVEQSLHVPYDYDIVAHIGYVMRYAPYEDKSLRYQEYKESLDRIFKTMIEKDKILEINGKADGCLPKRDLLEGYFALGGRKISFASDAHAPKDILKNRDLAMATLKEIGFTHITVPCKGEHIQVEI